MQQRPAAIDCVAPGRQHRFALGASSQPLGNAVDEQIGDLVFAQIPLGEGLVIIPQPRPQLRDRRPRQQQPPALVLEGILDVAHGEPARQHHDPQILERLGVPLQVLADRRTERFIASSNLWGRILDETLRRLHPAGSDPIPIALARAPPHARSTPVRPHRRLPPPAPPRQPAASPVCPARPWPKPSRVAPQSRTSALPSSASKQVISSPWGAPLPGLLSPFFDSQAKDAPRLIFQRI